MRNVARDHSGTPENEGEEIVQSALFGFQHDASDHTMAWLGPNVVPEVKEMTPQDLQLQTTQLPQTTQAPDITWGMLKKTTYKAEQILLQTQKPFTPDNLFLALLSGDAKPEYEQ